VEANASPRWSDQGIEVFTQKVAAFTQMPKKTHDENAENCDSKKWQNSIKLTPLATLFSPAARCAFQPPYTSCPF